MTGHRECRPRESATLSQRFQNFQSISIRKCKIQEHQIDRFCASALDRLSNSRRNINIIAGLAKEYAKRVRDERTILHD